MSIDVLRDKRIAVFAGGHSGEREVSLRTGAGVQGALRRQGFDAVMVDPRADLVTQLREVGAEIAIVGDPKDHSSSSLLDRVQQPRDRGA